MDACSTVGELTDSESESEHSDSEGELHAIGLANIDVEIEAKVLSEEDFLKCFVAGPGVYGVGSFKVTIDDDVEEEVEVEDVAGGGICILLLRFFTVRFFVAA